MDQKPGISTTDAAAAPEQSEPAGAALSPEPVGFRSRGGARRRARFLRKARELGYRDLGGLVFNLHRFGQRNDALVLAKLTTLSHIDAELRALEDTLAERRPVTVLREAGITACPRCAAIHSSDDSFCPNCGLSVGRHADLMADLRTGSPVPANGPAAANTPSSAPGPVQTPAAASGPPGASSTPVPPASSATPEDSASAPAPTNAPAPTKAPASTKRSTFAKRSTPAKQSTPAEPAPAEQPAAGDQAPPAEPAPTEDAASPAEQADPQAGRAPTPPNASAISSSSEPQSVAAARPLVEDGPTEILGPPVVGP